MLSGPGDLLQFKFNSNLHMSDTVNSISLSKQASTKYLLTILRTYRWNMSNILDCIHTAEELVKQFCFVFIRCYFIAVLTLPSCLGILSGTLSDY